MFSEPNNNTPNFVRPQHHMSRQTFVTEVHSTKREVINFVHKRYSEVRMRIVDSHKNKLGKQEPWQHFYLYRDISNSAPDGFAVITRAQASTAMVSNLSVRNSLSSAPGERTVITRTTRTPAFWGYPRRLMINHTIESCWIPSLNKVEWPWR